MSDDVNGTPVSPAPSPPPEPVQPAPSPAPSPATSPGQLIMMLSKVLPAFGDDAEAMENLLDATAVAVKRAQAGNGFISDADWATIENMLDADVAALARAAAGRG